MPVAPERSRVPSGAGASGSHTPMGPPENLTRPRSEHAGRKRPVRRPRTRRCLLKGCEQQFRPQRPQERYCSDACRRAARRWARWKAQQSYRATTAGKEKRNGQSRRYRDRVRNRKQTVPQQAVVEAARVITEKFFWTLLRPAGLLSGLRATAAIARPKVLFPRVPARHGTGLAARAALAPRHPAAVEQVNDGGGR
jgi:hypothetical protein